MMQTNFAKNQKSKKANLEESDFMTDKNYTPPEFSKELFTCPHCNLHTRHEWFPLKYSEKNYDKKQEYKYVQLSGITYISIGRDHGTDPTRSRLPLIATVCDHDVDLRNSDPHFRKSLLWASKCEECFRDCIWGKGNIIYPDFIDVPPPNNDLSPEVKEIYWEAASIRQKSPRAAAALLRLAIETLCIELRCKGKNLQDKINSLAKKDSSLLKAVEAMDIVRLVGNAGAHAGNIQINETPDIVADMFILINHAAAQLLTTPKTLASIIERAKKRLSEK